MTYEKYTGYKPPVHTFTEWVVIIGIGAVIVLAVVGIVAGGIYWMLFK